MAVYAIVGEPGSGKSYSVVHTVIIPKLKRGRIVYHNLTLNEAECMRLAGGNGMLVKIPKPGSKEVKRCMEARIAAAEAKGRYLASSVDRSETTRDLAEALVQNRPPGSTCVIDEVWKYWPAGLKTSSVPVAEMAFWKEHRHSLDWRGEGGDVYLIDQALDSGVAKFIRDLVHRTLIVTKHDAVGMAKRFVVDVYKGPVAIDKRKPKALLSSYQGKFKPEIFAAYKSHTHDTRGNDTGLEAVEERVSVQHTVFGSMMSPSLMMSSSCSCAQAEADVSALVRASVAVIRLSIGTM